MLMKQLKPHFFQWVFFVLRFSSLSIFWAAKILISKILGLKIFFEPIVIQFQTYLPQRHSNHLLPLLRWRTRCSSIAIDGNIWMEGIPLCLFNFLEKSKLSQSLSIPILSYDKIRNSIHLDFVTRLFNILE